MMTFMMIIQGKINFKKYRNKYFNGKIFDSYFDKCAYSLGKFLFYNNIIKNFM